MSIKVNFYDFAKRQNSTAQPTVSDLVVAYDCVLKAPTDVIRPVLLIEYSGAPTGMTYAQIPAFGRYYFIRTWRSVNSAQWECELEEDFLATWKGAIGSASKYVLRSSSSSDGKIIDSMYPAKSQRYQLTATHTESPLFSFDLSNATYVLGIIGNGDNNMGAINYYAFTSTQLSNLFANGIFDDATYGISPSDMPTEIVKATFNPFQYVASCMLFPFSATSYGTLTTTGVRFGWWNLASCQAYLLSKAPRAIVNTCNFAIPKHPQAATRGAYLNNAPFSSYYMEFPGFGVFDIDASMLVDGDALTTILHVDLISGACLLNATVQSNGSPLRQLPVKFGQIGVPIELAQIGREGGSYWRGIVGKTVEHMANYSNSKFLSNVSAITNAIEANNTAIQSQGTTGSLIQFFGGFDEPDLYMLYSSVVDNSVAEFGAPLCQVKTISSLSGYVLCGDGEVSIKGFTEERLEIERYLTTGFFYE